MNDISLTEVADELGLTIEKRSSERNDYFCPIHDVNTGDLSIYKPSHSRGPGFACHHEGGKSPVTLVMHCEGYSKDKAIEWMAEHFPDSFGNLDEEDVSRRQAAREVLQTATNVAHDSLVKRRPELYNEIQENRQFSEDTIEDVKIGFLSSDDVELLKSRFDSQALVDSGLFGQDEDSGEVYCHLENRVVFPYRRHNTTYFMIGRRTSSQQEYWLEQAEKQENSDPIQAIIDNDEKEADSWDEAKYSWMRSKCPKYKKTITTDYNKHLLYRFEGNTEETVVITEGVTDAISVFQAGYDVVSPVTTQFRDKDIEKVIEGVQQYDEVYIAMDPDEGGKKGAEKTAQSLVKSGIDPFVVDLPEGSDMDDWTTENGYEISELLDDSDTFLDVLIDRIESTDNRNKRKKLVSEVTRLISDWNDAEKATVVNELPVDKDTLEESQTQSVSTPPGERRDYFFNSENKFIPKWLGDRLLHDYNFVTTRDNEELFVYQDGVYQKNGDKFIKERSNRLLQEDARRRHINEVIHYIEAHTYIERDELNTNPYLISVDNGVYDIKNDELIGHDPSIRTTIQLPVAYNPDADCPEFKSFLDDVLADGDKDVVQEMFGYCLLKDYPYQKAFMLVGDGSNGKSTLLKVLSEILGQRNISQILLQKLEENRFATAELYGKLANIAADLPDQKLHSTGTFKMLTGGDTLTAERKRKDPFTFKNFATLIFSANTIPDSGDDTDAFFRRWVIINFPNKFTDDPDDGNPDADPDILDKITTEEELEGVLQWAIEGLQRVIENDGFSDSSTTDEIREKMQRFQSSLGAFVQDRVEASSDNYVSKEHFYNEYRQYCKDNGLPVKAKEVVGRELSQYVRVESSRPRINGRRQTAWKGIKLVSASEKSVEGTDGGEDLRDAILELSESEIKIKELISKLEASEEDIMDIIQTLKKDGDIFETKPNAIKKV